MQRIPSDGFIFPDPESSDHQGLLYIGGDLSPSRIVQAYSQGIFPWYNPGSPILWWSPNPRLILEPDEFKLSASLKKSLKKPFKLSIDTAFSDVIKACATNADRQGNTWITEEMIAAYCQLHQLGYAHSFEVWFDEQLVGGLYGISLGRNFFGESMFHKVTDASKIAFYFLSETMKDWHFDFIDCQIPSAHLQSLGAKVIGRSEFLYRLQQSMEQDWHPASWYREPILTSY